MSTFENDSWVWIPDPEECILIAKVKAPFKPGEQGKVQTEDGEIVHLNGKETECVEKAHEEVLNSSVDNLINLNELNENALLHLLRNRFKEDTIYTYVSSILISVNPFKLLPLYTPEMLEMYRQGSRGKPPHVFAIADNAYKNMLTDNKSQSIIISGESGAGKSEATKLMLQYIAEVSARASGAKTSQGDSLEQQILQANPIMEAFGNAKTVRNNNSSRFGKLITVRFNRSGVITGGCIINYLLEKSRVVRQAESERNYHIFYQLLAGVEADNSLKNELQLLEPEDYRYLDQSGVVHIDGVSDEKDFEDIRNAMRTLNFTTYEQMSIFKTVAALLHFGNVEFEVVQSAMQEDGSSVKNSNTLQIVSNLLGLQRDVMEKSLTSKNIGTRSIILVSYTVDQAVDVRDTIVKRIYANLFEWLIKKINVCLDTNESEVNSNPIIIGVLDIFGFESFENNSFEQLCINYCNEKLQFHFNEHIFRLEQEVYEAEGVTVPRTDFKDNLPTLELLEHKTFGIFSMIDEEISVPRGSDETFLSKLNQKQKDHPNFAKPRPGQVKDIIRCFGVRHYAGEVFYNITGFLEKNKDALHADIITVLQQSQSEFIRNLFPSENSEGSSSGSRTRSRAKPAAAPAKGKTKTLGGQFKQQLQELMDTLNSTFPHFVRCMKPNHLKKGSVFQSPMMLAQLRYAGLLEVCRIRKLGYPIRRDFDDFLKRYKCISPMSSNIDQLLQNLRNEHKLIEGQSAKGRTKVFMRNKQASDLEIFREEALHMVTIQIQKIIRRFLVRCRYLYYQHLLTSLKAAIGSRNETDLNNLLEMAVELPHGGSHIPVVQAGKALQLRLAEEKRVIALLIDAIRSRNITSLLSAVSTVDRMVPPFENQHVNEAKALVQRLQEEQQLKDDLKVTIQARNKLKLEELLQKADEMELADCEEIRQAVALQMRLAEEEEALQGLRDAIATKSINELNAYLSKASELGLDAPEIEQGYALQQHLMAQYQARAALAEAIKARELSGLSTALTNATRLGLDESCHEVATGKQLLQLVECEEEAIQQVVKATEFRQIDALSSTIEAAKKLGLSERAEVQDALTVLERIRSEELAVAALRHAVQSNDPSQLSAALQEASRLGLTGQAVDLARDANQKLGAQSEARTRLRNYLRSEDIPEITKAIEEAEKAGVGDCTELIECKAHRDRLHEQIQLIESLRAATLDDNLQELSRAIANCMKIGISNKYQDDMKAAKDKANTLGEYMKIEMNLQSAIKSKNLDSLINSLSRAHSVGLHSEKVEHAKKIKGELEEKKQIITQIATAIEHRNYSAIGPLLEIADKFGIQDEKVNQARVLCEREQYIAKARNDLNTAIKNEDLSALNNIMENVIQLAIEGPEVEQAKTLINKLSIETKAKTEIRAAYETLLVKGQNKSGIAPPDIDPLSQAIQQAKKLNLPSTLPELVQAEQLAVRMTRQLQCQVKLCSALATNQPDRKQLKEALDEAEDLELQLDVIAKVKAVLKNLDTEFRTKQQAVVVKEEEKSEVIEDFSEQERLQRQARAANPKYRFTNYTNLRSADDFAKGVVLNKKRVKELIFEWQNTLIPKSLTDLGREDNRIAIQIFKSLLGYMGDKQMSFPATLAQDILQKGLDNVNIRNEIYMQIMKQLTRNQRPESIAKGWQIMCMCVSTFPPSVDFENYLFNFILEKKNSRGAVRNYAKYCLRTLEGILQSGASGFVPTVEEIQAYKERPPILATIELVDGMALTEDLPITPDLNVAKVIEICTHFLQLKDSRADTFGIFVYDVEGQFDDSTQDIPVEQYLNAPFADLPRTPRPLKNEDFMGDVMVQKARQRRNFKFVFKRKIFLDSQNGPSNDQMFERLVYLQAEDEILTTGNLRFDDEKNAITLAATSVAVAMGDEFPADIAGLVEIDLLEFVPPNWREKYAVEKWAELILQRRNELVNQDSDTLQRQFLSIASSHTLYGGHFFYVHLVNHTSSLLKNLPKDLVICYNCNGMHILEFGLFPLVSFGYADIYRWGGSSTQFSLIVWSQESESTFELVLTTSQAADMAAIILDYINSIMASISP